MLALTILSLAALAAGSPMAPYVRDLSKRRMCQILIYLTGALC